jgi:hypothetical protein
VKEEIWKPLGEWFGAESFPLAQLYGNFSYSAAFDSFLLSIVIIGQAMILEIFSSFSG